MIKRDYDAVVVGSGPNGLAAAITLSEQGLSVLLLEGKDSIGGGMRSAAITLPGYVHDICSAIHPLAADSPVFKRFTLEKFGLEFIHPAASLAHPFDEGPAALLYTSIPATASQFEKDEAAYKKVFVPLLKDWPAIRSAFLGPLAFPANISKISGFAWQALSSATGFAERKFQNKKLRGMWAGLAAHSMVPLSKLSSSASALVLAILGHTQGWVLPKGGSQKIADALAAYFSSIGGKIETNFMVHSLNQLPSAHAVLFDVGPQQLLGIAGHSLSAFYRWQLSRYRYGMGAFKIDWALSRPIPFSAPECGLAPTVHLGNSFGEIATSEDMAWNKKHAEKPFVILSQPSLFDVSRAPLGKHTAWGYCHVPGGSSVSRKRAIEDQVERFAPGFKDCILATHTMNTHELENYNPNYINGDINGGILDLTQLFTRPALRFSPYRTSAKGLYLCSASTPPGGGVHGICGYYAARRALKDIFKIDLPRL